MFTSKPDSVIYVCNVNGETFEFQHEHEMLDFLCRLHDDGYSLNTLSMCKMKLYNINPQKFSKKWNH